MPTRNSAYAAKPLTLLRADTLADGGATTLYWTREASEACHAVSMLWQLPGFLTSAGASCTLYPNAPPINLTKCPEVTSEPQGDLQDPMLSFMALQVDLIDWPSAFDSFSLFGYGLHI